MAIPPASPNQYFTPTFDADMPQSVATHFRQLYLAINQHDQAIKLVAAKPTTITTVTAQGSSAPANPVIIPGDTPAIAHEAIVSYDASNGMFGQLQFDFADLTGIATTVQIGTGAPAAGDYVDGGTGAWTALPGGLTHVIPLGPLTVGGTTGSITVVNGRITASVDPT